MFHNMSILILCTAHECTCIIHLTFNCFCFNVFKSYSGKEKAAVGTFSVLFCKCVSVSIGHQLFVLSGNHSFFLLDITEN